MSNLCWPRTTRLGEETNQQADGNAEPTNAEDNHGDERECLGLILGRVSASCDRLPESVERVASCQLDASSRYGSASQYHPADGGEEAEQSDSGDDLA